MALWYAFWDMLPFEMFHWNFMKNALLAALILAGIAGCAFALGIMCGGNDFMVYYM